MTDIQQLIRAAMPLLPFRDMADAQAFLNTWSPEDQSALISAMCIGRDHIHAERIRPDYVSDDQSFDRFMHTGNAGIWLIQPEDFARILCGENTGLAAYFEAFERSATASGYSLADF